MTSHASSRTYLRSVANDCSRSQGHPPGSSSRRITPTSRAIVDPVLQVARGYLAGSVLVETRECARRVLTGGRRIAVGVCFGGMEQMQATLPSRDVDRLRPPVLRLQRTILPARRRARHDRGAPRLRLSAARRPHPPFLRLPARLRPRPFRRLGRGEEDPSNAGGTPGDADHRVAVRDHRDLRDPDVRRRAGGRRHRLPDPGEEPRAPPRADAVAALPRAPTRDGRAGVGDQRQAAGEISGSGAPRASPSSAR